MLFISLVFFLIFDKVLFMSGHEHVLDHNKERVNDGRVHEHPKYNDDYHDSSFDHEAILGSVKEAEEYHKLSPSESKRRLLVLLEKMDINGNNLIERDELHKWINISFIKLSKEDALDRFKELDQDEDSHVSWSEFIWDTFGVDDINEIADNDTDENGMLVKEDQEMFNAVDKDGNGKLNIDEFQIFSNPEEHEEMHPFLVKQTMREKDLNKDGQLSFQEYIGEKVSDNDKDWLVGEKRKFDIEYDQNGDGVLTSSEIIQWVIPHNDEMIKEEVDHLFAASDDDGDDLLAFDEILNHYDVFVGSEATQYGQTLDNNNFNDEL